MVIDERREDVVSDEIGRRTNGKQKRRRGGQSVELRDCVMNKMKREHIIVFLTLIHRYNAVRGHRTGSNNS